MYTTSIRSEIKVTDWGLRKDLNRESIALTAAGGELAGTPGYCAPEQWFTLDNIDGCVDIFSLGIIFYEMMTGKRPVVFDENDIVKKKM
jgi:serine/threonine protein kinase